MFFFHSIFLFLFLSSDSLRTSFWAFAATTAWLTESLTDSWFYVHFLHSLILNCWIASSHMCYATNTHIYARNWRSKVHRPYHTRFTAIDREYLLLLYCVYGIAPLRWIQPLQLVSIYCYFFVFHIRIKRSETKRNQIKQNFSQLIQT